MNCRTAHSLAWAKCGAKYRKKLTANLRTNTVMDVLDISSSETAKFGMETLLKFLVSADVEITGDHIPITALRW